MPRFSPQLPLTKLAARWRRIAIPSDTSHRSCLLRRCAFYSSSSSSSTTPAVYVAATRQHTGKTSVSLALLSGLQKRFDKVGVIKPVGQVSLNIQVPDKKAGNNETKTVVVDKDAALFKNHFQLDHIPWDAISPVLIPSGYTRDYLDGKISYQKQQQELRQAYQTVADASDFVLAEGTGHVGVGSIVDANNAQVASWIRTEKNNANHPIPMVLVVNGGLGRSFDEWNLNYNLCQTENVPIAGVIVNRILPHKYDQTVEYLQKALQKRSPDIPLLGCIPDRPFLGCPALTDLQTLLQGQMVVNNHNSSALLRHYRVSRDVHLVACSLQTFLRRLRHQRKAPPEHQRSLFVCHVSRQDILLGFLLESSLSHNQKDPNEGADWQSSLILTGCDKDSAQPPPHVLEIAQSMPNAPPILLTQQSTDQTLELLYQHTAKLNIVDKSRVDSAIDHYEPFIDFDTLLERVERLSGVCTTSTTRTNSSGVSGLRSSSNQNSERETLIAEAVSAAQPAL